MKILKRSVLLAIAAVVLYNFPGHSQGNPDALALFPADNQFEGWVLKDSIKTYNPENMYLHLGEVSGLYSEYGTLQSMEAVYVDAAATRIILEVFDMQTPDGSWGIFTMNSTGKGQPLELGDVATRFDYYIHFVKGNYYIRCSSSDKRDG